MLLKRTKLAARKTTGSLSSGTARSVRFTGRRTLCLSIVPLLMLSAGCSRAVSLPQMPQPPANLSAACPILPATPSPLADPERSLWEATLLALYADCAARHWHLTRAWIDAVKAGEK